MKDIRQILLTALVSALETATGKNVYTRMPKAIGAVYPYIYISDIYQEEVGPKTSYIYRLDVLIQIIYQDVDSLVNLFADMNNVLSIVNNGYPFALTAPHKVMSCELNNSTTTEFQTETGTQNVGFIRLIFNIE